MAEQEKIVLEAKELTKVYRGVTVLNQVSIQLKKGHIYGFVGNNGAGKTTFMRLVAGLARPTAGTVSLFGSQSQAELERKRSRAGFLIEQPVYYPDMSVRENLTAQAKLIKGADKAHVQELLELVESQIGLCQKQSLSVVLVRKESTIQIKRVHLRLQKNGILTHIQKKKFFIKILILHISPPLMKHITLI